VLTQEALNPFVECASGLTPQRIVGAHPSDQRAQVRVDLRQASKRAGFPTPVPAESGSVPSHEGLGANDRDGFED
jgi:hypothetical protein